MYPYLSAVGFSEYTSNKSIRKLKEIIKTEANTKSTYPINDGQYLFYYEKYFGECFGASLIEIGESEEDSDLYAFFPFARGYNYLFNEKFDMEKCTDQFGFRGLCDDNNIGIPLIFYVNDPIGYLDMKDHHTGEIDVNCATLSALACDGVILLPIEKDEYQKKFEKEENAIRNDMIDAAKSGDMEAMEQLTLSEMDKFTIVTRRARKEDVFSIVDSFFMPYTVECDKYSVLGEIKDVAELKNRLTGEELYYLSLDCNSIEFEVLINKKDILGMPEKGRRFKGHVWMQGQMDYL